MRFHVGFFTAALLGLPSPAPSQEAAPPELLDGTIHQIEEILER